MTLCGLCGSCQLIQQAMAPFVDTSCARCGILLARTPAHAMRGARA